MNFSFDDDPVLEAAERRLKRAALGEIERMRRIDEWIPSYANVHTRAALRGLSTLMSNKIIPKRMSSFLPYTRPGNQDDVRIEAFRHLITLGMMANDPFLQYLISSIGTEPSAFFRDRLWREIHRGLAMIALGITKMAGDETASAQPDGFEIDTGDALASRNELMERSTIEGAMKGLMRDLSSNQALQEAISDALR